MKRNNKQCFSELPHHFPRHWLFCFSHWSVPHQIKILRCACVWINNKVLLVVSNKPIGAGTRECGLMSKFCFPVAAWLSSFVALCGRSKRLHASCLPACNINHIYHKSNVQTVTVTVTVSCAACCVLCSGVLFVWWFWWWHTWHSQWQVSGANWGSHTLVVTVTGHRSQQKRLLKCKNNKWLWWCMSEIWYVNEWHNN